MAHVTLSAQSPPHMSFLLKNLAERAVRPAIYNATTYVKMGLVLFNFIPPTPKFADANIKFFATFDYFVMIPFALHWVDAV